MNIRAAVRSAFPYLVIAVAGFAVAYIIVFVFVLPEKLVPNAPQPYRPDSSNIITPVDSGVQPTPDAVVVAPPVGASSIPIAPSDTPVDVANLVGMELPDARGVLNSLQLNTTVLHDTSSITPPNTVLRQAPEAGAKVSAHGTVTVTASMFPPLPDSEPQQDSRPLPPIRAEPDAETP